MINEGDIDQVRRFERLFERYLRKVQRTVATEDFGVADCRVLHELGFVDGGASGAFLAGRLGLDASYLHRILRKLEAYGLLGSRDSAGDGRMKDWELTDLGRNFAASIEKEYREGVWWALLDFSAEERHDLVAALAKAERLLQRHEVRFPYSMRDRR